MPRLCHTTVCSKVCDPSLVTGTIPISIFCPLISLNVPKGPNKMICIYIYVCIYKYVILYQFLQVYKQSHIIFIAWSNKSIGMGRIPTNDHLNG